jgi:L-amino acid N-acyltransferase YncA
MAAQNERYPIDIPLGDGSVLLRPPVPADRDAILAFARALPQHDLLFLRRDITRPEEVDGWITAVERGELATVLAIRDDAVVGSSVVARSRLDWMRHVAELRVMVAGSMRGQGLGRLLTTEAFRIASDMGVEKMVAQMTTDQRTAIAVFQNLGFENEAILHDHVKDRDGKSYDLLILRRSVSGFEASVILEEYSAR